MFHDASVCVVEDGEILFAGHAERYSRQKNDAYLNKGLMKDALKHGLPDVIVLGAVEKPPGLLISVTILSKELIPS